MSAVPLSPKRVLIYRLGSLGDTVIALPVLHLTARAYPNAERRMLTSFPPNAKAPPSSAVLDQTGLVHGYLRYTYGTRSPKELLAVWWRIVRWRPELVVYMAGPRGISVAKRDALFFRLCGVRHIVGVPDQPDNQQYRQLKDHVFASPYVSGLPLEHECSRLARNLSELGDARLRNPASWDLRLTQAECTRAEEVLLAIGDKPFIAASIGTKMQSKDWGCDNWTLLLERIAHTYPGYALILSGAAEEWEASEAVRAGWNDSSTSPSLNLCGVLSPREAAAVFGRAVLFVGHDSGPMHLAAAVQTPCVAIFSARNLPNVWFPFGDHHQVVYHNVDCQNCNLETCIVQKKKCMTSITVDEVFSKIVSQLPSVIAKNK